MGDREGIRLVPDALCEAFGRLWRFDGGVKPAIVLEDGREIPFDGAREKETREYVTGLGPCRATRYGGFEGSALRFETLITLDRADGRVDCSFVPLDMAGLPVREVRWPQPLTADEKGSYAVLNTMQGQLLPTDWPEEIGAKLPFDGQMCSEAAYLPWFGEVTGQGGYLCYVRSPWDSKYTVSHPAGGPTRLYVRHLPSLGRMEAQRTVSYYFFAPGCDYVTLCKRYRAIALEEGRLVTLREKAQRDPGLERLIGCCVLHVDGKTHVTPDSAYYDREQPEKNDRLTPFSHWAERVDELRRQGVERLYLHLDGWGQPGYDNQHPDYLPPCREAGGYEGLKALQDRLHESGYLFGLHDQYRDYYLDAPTYDADNAVRLADGKLFEMSRWAGGRQNYLCASLAPEYVRRNFEQLLANGIRPDATYLDVFTCNEADECSNPRHVMTRRECLSHRGHCLDYLTAHGILPSSEEVNDWAIPYQVFCHWAPYLGNTAIPVPLFNLVYHDCVLIPWKMEAGEWGIPKGTAGFLHALLNGGMGYLSERLSGEALEENIRQVKAVGELQRRVAMEELVSHEFLSEDRSRQRTVFSDGTRVTVDFKENTWQIDYPVFG